MANQCWMMISVQQTEVAVLPKFGASVDIILCGNEEAPLFVFIRAHTLLYDSMTAAFKVEKKSAYECRFPSSFPIISY